MEREVFENESIAELMNQKFVNIKVDREERPDVDRIYMTALQSMTGSGGWPMSMFLTPDRTPFYGATYIPPDSRYGRSGFPEVIGRLSEAWLTRRKDIIETGEKLRAHLNGTQDRFVGDEIPSADALGTAFTSFTQMYDEAFGGFGGAPKFPRPVVFNFLLRYSDRTGDGTARDMVVRTLERMSAGGMYDHVGGGFHRYSTDAEWHVPHFEKMLYDQAQLVVAYLEAYLVTRNDAFRDIAEGVLRYVSLELRSPEGAFYSAEDAESVADPVTGEKREGAFYVWTKEEVIDVLGEDDANLFCKAYDVQDSGNVTTDPHKQFVGVNVLRRNMTSDDLAAEFGIEPVAVDTRLRRCLEKLAERRSTRTRPHRDDKVLTSWNGMMISAFARAATILGEAGYLAAAMDAAAFLMTRMVTEKGTLLRRHRDGEARFEGGLEDYAWVIQAHLDLYDASFDPSFLTQAQDLLRKTVELFFDEEQGGFYDTVASDPSLIARMKESYDGAEPSANAVLAGCLIRMSDMLHDDSYRTKTAGILKCFSEVIQQAPHAAPQLLVALDHYAGPSRQIVLVGDPDKEDFAALRDEVHSRFLPRSVQLHVRPESPLPEAMAKTEFLSSLQAIGGNATAYVCRDFACDLPITSALSLAAALGAGST